MSVRAYMKNPYIIPAAIIGAAILAGFWILKPSSEYFLLGFPQKKSVQSSFFSAARKGDIEAVKKHLSDGADINAKQVGIGWSALHTATSQGNKEVAGLLIAEGAKMDSKTRQGWTALFMATLGSHKEIVELLISNGADVNAKNDKGWTPLDLVETVSEEDSPEVQAADKEIADLLREHGGKTGEELKAEGK